METKHYNTVGREKLVAYLRAHAADTPMSAQEIFVGLCTESDAPGYSSVYRLLSKLVSEGTVRRLRAPAPAKGYLFQYVDTHACHAHFHLKCTQCNELFIPNVRILRLCRTIYFPTTDFVLTVQELFFTDCARNV